MKRVLTLVALVLVVPLVACITTARAQDTTRQRSSTSAGESDVNWGWVPTQPSEAGEPTEPAKAGLPKRPKSCRVVRATPELDTAPATLLLEGELCLDPSVAVGRPGGTLEPARADCDVFRWHRLHAADLLYLLLHCLQQDAGHAVAERNGDLLHDARG